LNEYIIPKKVLNKLSNWMVLQAGGRREMMNGATHKTLLEK
jgi:hypothetical protein